MDRHKFMEHCANVLRITAAQAEGAWNALHPDQAQAAPAGQDRMTREQLEQTAKETLENKRRAEQQDAEQRHNKFAASADALIDAGTLGEDLRDIFINMCETSGGDVPAVLSLVNGVNPAPEVSMFANMPVAQEARRAAIWDSDPAVRAVCSRTDFMKFGPNPSHYPGDRTAGASMFAAPGAAAAADPLLAAANERDLEERRVKGLCFKIGIDRATFDRDPVMWRNHAKTRGLMGGKGSLFSGHDPLLAAADEADLEDRRINGMCHKIGIDRATFDKAPAMWRNHAKQFGIVDGKGSQFAATDPLLAAADEAELESRRIEGLCHKIGIDRATFDKDPVMWRNHAQKTGIAVSGK